MNPNGSHVHQLTHNTTFDERPTYSPNGKRIAFDSGTGAFADIEIFSMRAGGSDRHQLTHNPGFDELPDWGRAP
jgi:TolB protein